MDHPPVVVSERFAHRIVTMLEEEGAAWLERLPAIVARCADSWSLTVAPPYLLSYNYVAPAVQADGTSVVLKVSPPDGEYEEQSAALRLFDGDGMVRLLAADDEERAMLLERLEPGTPLSTLVEEDDEQATSLLAEVMRRVRRPAPAEHPFPTVAEWAVGLQRLRQRFDGGTGPLPARLVDEAEALFAGLLGSEGPPMLLHGDLHHDNVLAAQRAPWLAIDPKGLVGDPGYEVGAIFYNPKGALRRLPDPGRVIARRVLQLADELDMDRARVRGWGLAQAVLSAWWSLEDHGAGWEWAITCGEYLSALKV